MLLETFIFTKAGVAISYYKNPEYKGEELEEALISSFISALMAFSEQTLKSDFKGMVLDDKQLLIIQDEVVIVGVFSLNETASAARRILKKILKEFKERYKEEMYRNYIIEDKQLFIDTLKKNSKTMFSIKRVFLTFIITIAYSIIVGVRFLGMREVTGSKANQLWSTLFREWLIGIIIIALINGYIISDRKWALVLSFINSLIPAGTILFIAGNEKLLPAEDTAVLYIIVWFAVAFLFDNLYLSKEPVPSPFSLVPKIFRKKT